MDIIEQIKQQLAANNVNESEVDAIGELLVQYKDKVVTEAKTEADASLETLIEEGVKERTITLEAQHIEALEKDRENAKLALESEMRETTKTLAGRVKRIVESALKTHGDRIVQIEESRQTDTGKTILEQIQEVVGKAQKEISESQQADPEEMKSLKERIAVLETETSESKKRMIHEQARANVAETSLKVLRESIDEGLSVTVVEDKKDKEPAKTVIAEADHPDSKATVIEEGVSPAASKRYTPEMEHMRRLAGIKS